MSNGYDVGNRILSGPESSVAAQLVQQKIANRELWPYSWVYPQQNATRREPAGSIAAPVAGTQAEILAFQVPTNFSFIWSSLMLVFEGGGFVPGSGAVTWTVDLDTEISAPRLLTAIPLPDYYAILFPRGSYGGPWTLSKTELIKSGQTLRAKVLTTAAITPGAPNYFSALFGGWLVPSGAGAR